MNRNIFHIAILAMALTGCSDSSLTALEPATHVADTDVVIPSDATSG